MPFSGVGFGEMLVIALIVLVVFGPRRLPEISRSMGKAIREFKRGMNEIQRELQVAEREERWKTTRPVGSTAGTASAPGGASPTSPSPAEGGPTIASPDHAKPPAHGAVGGAGAAAAATGPWGTAATPEDIPAETAGGKADPEADAGAEPEADPGPHSGAPEDGTATEDDPLQSDLFSGDRA